jgi:hypothetical protein
MQTVLQVQFTFHCPKEKKCSSAWAPKGQVFLSVSESNNRNIIMQLNWRGALNTAAMTTYFDLYNQAD